MTPLKQAIRDTIVRCIRFFLQLPGKKIYFKVSRIISDALAETAAEIVSVPTKAGKIDFYCIGDIPVARANSLLTKEPETIDWIHTFDLNDVFWDIGANVGNYSLYAAKVMKAQVLAFEPSAANYLLINRSIEINGLGEAIKAYCLALNDVDMLSAIHMQNTKFGGALTSFDTPVDFKGDEFEAFFKQGMVGLSIDGFVEKFNPLFPNRIKIDVDGIEDKIIQGGLKTLSDKRVKSVSIELDDSRPEYTQPIIDALESCGLKFQAKKHAPILDGGVFAGIYNFHFFRV